VPELEKEEIQEEFGWEKLSAHDDGSRDMGDVLPPKAEDPKLGAAEVAETAPTPEPVPELKPDAEKAVDKLVADGTVEVAPDGGETPKSDVVYTLPGGKKVTKAELIADDKLLGNLVTHSNQLTHFQKLAEDRATKLAQAEAEKREALDKFTQFQMTQQQQQQQQQLQQQQAAPPRPPAKVIESFFEPALNTMVSEGRLTEDHKKEFGGLIAEHLFDMAQVHHLINQVIQAGSADINEIRSSLQGEVIPNVNAFKDQRVRSVEAEVQQQAAAIPGYEALANPEEWQKLTEFVTQKIMASGVDSEGKPIFNPNLDPQTAAQMYDAMTGADLRAQLAAQQAMKAQQAADGAVRAAVSGDGAARAGGPPVVKQPSTMTPFDEAMDFSDPQMSTG
jgi:hypothetical protein